VRVLVTGGAGFIGSHTAEALVARGDDVLAVDCSLGDGDRQRANTAGLGGHPRFERRRLDLRTADVASLLREVDAVVHLAALPGVRASWASGFPAYLEHNVTVTQRLLEAAADVRLTRFVHASSSSVYGQAPMARCHERAATAPHSPYGITKLASEHLCRAYAANHGVPTTSLRYFTVYGPRQRDDMAVHRLFRCALDGEPFQLFGDGSQVRDLTAVGDVVAANLAALDRVRVPAGTVLNIGGGSPVTLTRLIGEVESLTGRRIEVHRTATQAGDVARTGAATGLAASVLGWRAETPLDEGLARQLRWHQEQRAPATASRA
jgi:nucleoside-diphosphate-sugar epimerase